MISRQDARNIFEIQNLQRDAGNICESDGILQRDTGNILEGRQIFS